MKIAHFQVVVMIFCAAMLLGSCGNDNQAREAATVQALESSGGAPLPDGQSAQPATTPDPSNSNQSPPPPTPTPASQPPAEFRPKMGGTMNIAIGSGSASKGEEVCVSISPKNFKAIMSMQYTMKWDNKVLKFKSLKNFTLPGLGADNFGKHILDKGLLTYSWFDAAVQGISKGDGESIYEICFEAVGTPGSKSAVQIVDSPTVIEITNANKEFFNLDATPGTVLIK